MLLWSHPLGSATSLARATLTEVVERGVGKGFRALPLTRPELQEGLQGEGEDGGQLRQVVRGENKEEELCWLRDPCALAAAGATAFKRPERALSLSVSLCLSLSLSVSLRLCLCLCLSVSLSSVGLERLLVTFQVGVQGLRVRKQRGGGGVFVWWRGRSRLKSLGRYAWTETAARLTGRLRMVLRLRRSSPSLNLRTRSGAGGGAPALPGLAASGAAEAGAAALDAP